MLRCRIVATTTTMIKIIQPKTGENNEPTSSTKAIPMGQRQSAPKMNNPNMKIFRANLMVKIFSNYFMCACTMFVQQKRTLFRHWIQYGVEGSGHLVYLYCTHSCDVSAFCNTQTRYERSFVFFYLISTTPSAIPLRFHLFCDAFLLLGVFLLQNLTPLF